MWTYIYSLYYVLWKIRIFYSNKKKKLFLIYYALYYTYIEKNQFSKSDFNYIKKLTNFFWLGIILRFIKQKRKKLIKLSLN